jgi:glycosyltransferase (activator-dependent family)
MKVMLTCFAAPTHYYSLVPLAWALRAAGHEVRVASQPDLAGTITQAGLTAVPVGPSGWFGGDRGAPELLGQAFLDSLDFVREFDYTGQDLASWNWRKLLELEHVASSVMYSTMNSDPMVDGLVEFARGWQPDLVIWEMYTFAGAIAARATGAAHARFLWGPDIALRARHAMLRLAEAQPTEHRVDPTAEWLGSVSARFGGQFDEEIVTGQWTVDITPSSMRLDVDVHTLGVRYIPYNGPSVVPDWLHTPPDRPRVCLTLGLTSRSDGQAVDSLDEVLGSVSLGDMLDAVADLDAEVIATLDPEVLTEIVLPDNVRAVGFAPLNDLLPTCSVVMHQGGSGTRSTAEVHGVPQLMLTDPWDAVRGQSVERCRAGLTLPRAEVTADLLRESLQRLLEDSSFTAGARRVQQEVLAEPSPNELVPHLEKLTTEHRRQLVGTGHTERIGREHHV